jgi:hypothetical protein
MKNQININLKNTFKIIFTLILTTLILSCSKEEPEFMCNGDFFLEKRIVRDASPEYINAFPAVKKCFKVVSVSKNSRNNHLELDVNLAEVGDGALGNYLTFTLYHSSVNSSNQNHEADIYSNKPEDFKLDIHQYLHDHKHTGVSFNAISSTLTLKSSTKMRAGAYNFKVLSIDKDTRTLTFSVDKIIGISGQDSYIEYFGFRTITIKIPE